MKRLCATGLILAIGWQPIAAASPLERSLSREASRLARESSVVPDRSAWQAVRLLEPGSPIVITTADTVISGAFESVAARTLGVKRNGAIERVALDDVLVVEKRVRRGSALAAALAAAGGLWLGSALAVGIGFSVRCQPNCGGVEAGMFALAIGTPIAAGYGAWRGTSHIIEEVIYRRPSAARP
jgi:hypothetical protein